jgi:hypothetical protein
MDHPAEDPLAQLRKAIVSQKTAALPDHPSDPALIELHNKIADYDRHVSETVIAILGGGSQASPYPAIAEVNALLERASAAGGGANRAPLALYQRYKERLDRMLDLALAVAKTRL